MPVTIDFNIGPLMLPVQHGRHPKDMVVLHETISPDYPGLRDILAVARYMPSQGLGIHGIVDSEGKFAWAVNMDTAILYHASSKDRRGVSHGVNTRSIGLELVSRVPQQSRDNRVRFAIWRLRNRQLEKTARVLAYLHRTHGIPLAYSDGSVPGVTTHYSVSKTWDVPGGHVDCWPKHHGGYFPALLVIYRARQLASKGAQ